MDIKTEKLHLIERLIQLQDATIVSRVNAFLQSALEERDELLENSIDKGVEQSKSNEVHDHENVMSDMRAKYGS
ncbi:hypothetical protein [uncultured Roseivirga sp.]|uniref:hypothetical protein n=1 Tax=uncultured Roseivirga sp. TaxID=543088 RepID=UPI0030DAF965|tara:strand:- start:267572 stop:267793 length:222 start_codon:yes stop_codon:yes gene_type:complete